MTKRDEKDMKKGVSKNWLGKCGKNMNRCAKAEKKILDYPKEREKKKVE